METTYVNFKNLDAPYRFWKYPIYNSEYNHYEFSLNEIYFELTTKDGTLVNAIQDNQDKEIVVESYRGDKVTIYTLKNYTVRNVIVTKELCNKPYEFKIKISSNRIQNVEYNNIIDWEKEKEKEKQEDYNMRSLYEMLQEERREVAHILTPKIENIYANKEKGTIVIKWQTGETTKVTCHEGDTWDLEKGIMACITKYVLGNNYNAGNILNKYIGSVKYTESK